MNLLLFGSHSGALRRLMRVCCALALLAALAATAQGKPAANSAPDLLVLSNGDALHGKLLSEINGVVTFHTEALGDVTVKWADVKELHTGEPFGVLNKSIKVHGKNDAGQIPVGALDIENQTIAVHAENGAAPASIPAANAAYIVDQATLNQQVYQRPSLLTGWTGAATAGATIVKATQNQYAASGSIGLVRTVPGVAWLDTRNRTSADFSGSFGKITEPGITPTKTALFLADAERDRYFSSRFFGLGQVAFDHNFSQGLALQSIFGGGIGFTAFKTAVHELDFKGTIQYERQQFLATPPTPASPSQNLIGSTLALNYAGKWKLFSIIQEVAFIPAYNTPRDYSADETDTLAFPAYKNFSFSIGTLDSYLNDPPVTAPSTKPNSFQFTTGLTYSIKSKY